MKLSDGVEAAIHCSATLASLSRGATLSAAALAESYGLSSSYLLKHLAKLVDAGICGSVSGPTGGYYLARLPEEVTLEDIVLAVEGHQPAFRCSEIRRAGPNPLPDNAYPAPCGINRAMLGAERAYREALRKTRLSDLVRDFEKTSDPRVMARSCAFVDLNQRRRG